MTSDEQVPDELGEGKPPRQRRGPRSALERGFVRLIATVGVIGIGIGIGAIMSSSKVQGWIIGLVVAVVTFLLTGVLRSARQLKP